MPAASAAQSRTSEFECQVVSASVFAGVLRSVDDALFGNVPYALIGGVGCAVYGRPRWSYDIDLFVAAEDARPALERLSQRGFATDELDPTWIFKAIRDGVLVDVIFKTTGDIVYDPPMRERTQRRSFLDVPMAVAPPEDLIVIKATVAKERRPHHWYDGIGIIARFPLDWDYLVWRARHGPQRVASMLLYAQSEGHPVPDDAIRRILDGGR